MKKVLFWILSLTWGLPYSLIGLVVALFMLITEHKPHHIGPEIYFECSENFPGGCNLGPVFLVWKSAGKSTKLHECGHSIQNIIWGPAADCRSNTLFGASYIQNNLSELYLLQEKEASSTLR